MASYTEKDKEEILTKIFSRVANKEAVRSVLKDKGYPTYSTFTNWVTDHTKNGKRYSAHIEAISSKDALYKAIRSGLRDIEVMGKLIMTVSTKNDGFTPDWNSRIDYDVIESN